MKRQRFLTSVQLKPENRSFCLKLNPRNHSDFRSAKSNFCLLNVTMMRICHRSINFLKSEFDLCFSAFSRTAIELYDLGQKL